MNDLIIRPIGVTTIKKIVPIIIGDINFPNKIPNLNQSLFNGLKKLEFINPRTKKIKEIIKDQILTSLSEINGQRAIAKNTIKKTIPKLLLDPITGFIIILYILIQKVKELRLNYLRILSDFKLIKIL